MDTWIILITDRHKLGAPVRVVRRRRRDVKWDRWLDRLATNRIGQAHEFKTKRLADFAASKLARQSELRRDYMFTVTRQEPEDIRAEVEAIVATQTTMF